MSSHALSRRFLVLILLIVLTLPAAVYAAPPLQTQTTPNPLLDMLALIPDLGPEGRVSSQLDYIDWRAMEAASGSTRPASGPAWLASGKKDDWFNGLLRISVAYNLGNLMQLLGGMPQKDGFDWLDIDRSLDFIPTPTNRQTVYAGNFNSDAIAKALAARSFDKTSIGGVTVWSHFKDNETNLDAVDPGDLFIGDLGRAARVAILPGYLGYTYNTGQITDMIGAYQKTLPSLADANDYRLLVGAISDPAKFQQPVIQAVFMPSSTFEMANISRVARPPADLSTYGDLPPYQLAAFADHQEGTDQVNTIAILCADSASAQQAATELQKRIAGFDVARNYVRLHVTIDPAYVYPDKSGKTQFAAAVVSVRYPLPSTTQATAQTGQLPRASLIFYLWTSTTQRREFFPLVPGKPTFPTPTPRPSN